jgi:two-component system phosphate regulon sensor histidine kinase PhoR
MEATQTPFTSPLQQKLSLGHMFQSRRAHWRAIFTYVLVIAGVSILLILLLHSLISSAFHQLAGDLARRELGLMAAAPGWAEAWANGPEAIEARLQQWPIGPDERLIALSPTGDLVAEATLDAIDRVGVSLPAEVRNALASGSGSEIRTGERGTELLYVAQRVESDGKVLGLLYWSTNLQFAKAAVERLQMQMALSVLAAAALLITFVIFYVERTTVLLRRLTAMVERALVNKYDGHVLAFSGGEIGQLTNAVNLLIDKHRKAIKRRARERDRLATVMTHMTTGALILTDLGRVRLLNPAAATILGTTMDAAVRKSFVQVVWDHRIAEVWQRCQQTNNEETETIDLGGDRLVRVTVTPFISGDASGYLVMLQDLTHIRRLEKMRRDFVSNVSHELRTPLASLTALVDTLRDGALDDPPAAARFLDRIEVEVDKMAQMVQELLELSRIESGQVPLRLNPTRVTAVILPAVERLTMQAERARLTLQVDIPADLPWVIADVERIQQVVINLVHNAIKFTPPGGQVTIAARPDQEMMTISVVDTGVGIPNADQARIFERFYKADRSRSGGGTGLGLAIVKHTVQAHNGHVWVESVEGKGSRFFFTLPLVNHPFTQA